MGGTRGALAMLCASFFASFAHAQEFCNDSIPVRGAPRQMPSRGYITCCNPNIMKDVARMVDTMKAYLRRGGRLIDTAPLYGLETGVGVAVRDAGVPRHEIWLSSKVETFGWSADFGDPAAWVLAEVDKSLQALGVSYIDVMYLHAGPAEVELLTGTVISMEEFQGMWRGLIAAKRLGKILYLGVCMTMQLEIEHLMQIEPPAVALVWFNPWMPDGQLAYAEWLKGSGIAVIAYGFFYFKELPLPYAKLRAVTQAGERHGVTYGQFLIQWVLQQGYAFVTGLYHEEYLLEDAVCLNFNVTSNDNAILRAQQRWPCKYGEQCGNQYIVGCYPPELGPYHHVQSTIDTLSCLLLFARGRLLSEELPRGRFHLSHQELIFGVSVMSMLLATAAAIWNFSKRGVTSEAGLSVTLLE